MNNLSQIKEIIAANKSAVKERFHVIDIGVFGSYARGEQTDSSDIDILVQFERGYKDLFNFIRLQGYFEELFGKKVDLVTKEGIKPALKDSIFNEVQYV
jgi:uncharacterized protein